MPLTRPLLLTRALTPHPRFLTRPLELYRQSNVHVVLYQHVAHAPPRDPSYRPLVQVSYLPLAHAYLPLDPSYRPLEQAFVHPLHIARNLVYADMAPFADVVVSVRTYLACVQNGPLAIRRSSLHILHV